MIRIAGESAGALCMSADRFVTELKSVKQIVAHNVEAAMAKVNGQPMRPEKLWGTNIYFPPPVQQQKLPPPLSVAAPNIMVPSSNIVETTNGNRTMDDLNNTTTTSTAASSSAPVKGAQQVEDGKFVYRGRFGRGNLIIEDKRNKSKKSKGTGG